VQLLGSGRVVHHKKSKIDQAKFSMLFAICIATAGCAHKTVVPPSKGHIDGNLPTQANNQLANQNAANTAPIPKPIRSNPQLPTPKATTTAQTYSVVVNEVPVKEILFALARESKLNIDIHPSIQGRVTLNAVDQTLPAILERLAKQVDLTYKMDGNVLYIAPDQPVLRTYLINYVNLYRKTTSEISVSQEIASSSAARIGANGGGASAAVPTSGSNTSETKVESTSENKFWDTLIQNIRDILSETDKEVLVKRYSEDSALRDTYNIAGSSIAQGRGSATTFGGNSSNNNSGNQIVGGNVSSGAATGAGNQSLDAESVARRDALKESNAKEYRQLFAAQIIANKENGVLSVRATQRQQEKVQEFIDKIQASAKRQVLIEATIVEVQLNDAYQAGIDFSRLNNPGNSGFQFQQTLGPNSTGGSAAGPGFFSPSGNGNFTGAGTNALGIGTTAGFIAGYLNPASGIGNIAASITLLKQFGDTKVLSSPKLMVLNSQTAILKAVDNLVYFTVQSTPAILGATGSIISPAVFTTTPHTVPVGIWMSVTPQINENGVVTLNVRPTISRQSGFSNDPNPDLTVASPIPQITVREMESVLQIPSGNTVVMGGLMQDEIQRNTDKVPGLSDIPGVGKAFTGRNDSNRKTELVIFLRPTVITNASLESDELQSYKQYLPAQQLQNVLEEAN